MRVEEPLHRLSVDGQRRSVQIEHTGRGLTMEKVKAKELLRSERLRVETLIGQVTGNAGDDRTAANQPGDMFDSAQPLTEEGTDEAILAGLQERLAAIDRAEARLDAGTYGYSVRSGQPIPDERLEVDPAAELTVEEASEAN
jgi:DnaK suppressor protein